MALSRKLRHLPDAVALQARRRPRRSAAPASPRRAGGHRGQDGRGAQPLGRDVGRVGGEQRRRDLHRRVVEPPADLGDHPDRRPGRPPRRPPRRQMNSQPASGSEKPRHGRRDRDLVGHQRGRVVDQALALEHGDERRGTPSRRMIAVAATGRWGRRSRRARRPRPTGARGSARAPPRHQHHREQHQPDRDSAIGRRFARRSRRSAKNAPEYSSGGRKSTSTTSGSTRSRQPRDQAHARPRRPRARWDRGFIARAAAASTTTATNSATRNTRRRPSHDAVFVDLRHLAALASISDCNRCACCRTAATSGCISSVTGLPARLSLLPSWTSLRRRLPMTASVHGRSSMYRSSSGAVRGSRRFSLPCCAPCAPCMGAMPPIPPRHACRSGAGRGPGTDGHGWAWRDGFGRHCGRQWRRPCAAAPGSAARSAAACCGPQARIGG